MLSVSIFISIFGDGANMRIAVNTRFLLKGKLEGIGIYTRELFRRIVQQMPEHEFYFFFDRPYAEELVFAGNVKPVVLFPPARHPLLWYIWFEHSVPQALKNYKADLFISPDGYASLNTDVPQILTLHDLGFEHYPGHVPFLARKYYRYYTPKFARKAHTIVAVSEYTKHDITWQYQVNAEKITTIYNGFDAAETVLQNIGDGAILQRHGLQPKKYFIFIGAVHPRKNVLGIVRAFELFKQKTRSEFRLLLVGRDAWLNKGLHHALENSVFKNDITWIKEVERKQLLQLLQEAYALVFPSLFEGFGIPVIEAMTLGVPVITSDVSALPEVAGGTALLCDPQDHASISREMIRLYEDPSLYASLIGKGKSRAQFFSWDKSADQWVQLIRQFSK